ncbi:MetQ/NlpA family ABC transporter substrate-binding protein [Pararhodospirillum oryzae]|nr:MetQ/NlpA family ABC transporter substrate-binding protein [Pararhodospirillum oryzae]
MKTLIKTAVVALGLALPSLGAHAAQPLTVGVSAGPYAEILEYVGHLYEQQEGIPVKVVEFADYTLPNAALAQGDIDFNNFQHKPYLENQIRARGYDLSAVEPSIVVPLGLYSKGLTRLEDLPQGAQVAIPNDPSNGARALLLLQQAGLLSLDPGRGVDVSVADITGNPRDLKIREIDAAQLPRALDDVPLAAVPLNYALAAKLDPKSALVREGADSPWGLWFVTRTADREEPRIRKFIALYRSAPVRDFILTRFEGSILPTW